jgi:hypothetical protein
MKTGRLISNNPRIAALQSRYVNCDIQPGKTAYGILLQVRDAVHLGYRLLTHPLHSSLKPNETPYRTVMISAQPASGVDAESLNFIEEAIQTYARFWKDGALRGELEHVRADFQAIDFDLIAKAIQ